MAPRLRYRAREGFAVNHVPLTRDLTAAEVVTAYPPCARVLLEAGIDFCCRGEERLGVACARLGLDPTRVLARLEEARRGAEPARVDLRSLSSEALVEHLVSTHHAYLRQTLPHLVELATKVARVHGRRDPRLEEVEAMLQDLSWLLLGHLDHEERELFPALCANARWARLPQALADMRREHEDVGALLARLRTLTDGHRAPEWACRTYRVLLAELARLEEDTLLHVHTENHVLAPRFASAAPTAREAAPEAPAGDAIEELVRDHESILLLLGTLERLADPARSNAALPLLRRALELLHRFADEAHHAKEERCLFPALNRAGLPLQMGPLAVMLHEHDQGRTLTRAMDAALEALAAGRPGAAQELERAARLHVQHLRQHIAKENQVLFPMARQLLAAPDLGALQEPCRALVEAVLGPQREPAARAEVASLAEESLGRPVAV